MKHPFLKTVLIAGAVMALMSCGDDATNAVTLPDISQNPGINNPSTTTPSNPVGSTVTEPCWKLDADQTYLINTSYVVTDVNGATVGIYNPETQSIVALDGVTPIVGNVDLNVLPVLVPEDTTSPEPGNPGTGNTTPSTPSTGTPNTPNGVVVSSSSVIQQGISSSSVSLPNTQNSSSSVGGNNQQQNVSSSSQAQQNSDGTCFDKNSNKNVQPYTEQVGKNGEKYAYKNDCSIDCWWDGSNSNCANIFGTGSNNNNTQQPKSSSSQQQQQAKSSSSTVTAKSSSSQQVQSGTTGNYTIKYVAGGKSGSGWATRYWDCCKPHCAWPGKGGIQAHACDASGNRINDDGATSMCDGGNSGTCKSQIPIVVNENLAFAFAAVPGSAGGECGKCFDLEFTGKGKYATDNHTALKGKHLIVIASNIGYDVAEGQFDIMIPGGGFGIFDGCSAKMGWGSQGARYGGLLTECEESSGYKASTYKSCLTSKCNASFSSDPQAKEGCLFLANWMNAAGNPLHNFREVECPKELLDKF